jgi:hypothetical protein
METSSSGEDLYNDKIPIEDMRSAIESKRLTIKEIIDFTNKLGEKKGWIIQKDVSFVVREIPPHDKIKESLITTRKEATFGDLFFSHFSKQDIGFQKEPTDFLNVHYHSVLMCSLEFRYSVNVEECEVSYFSEEPMWRLALGKLTGFDNEDERKKLSDIARRLKINLVEFGKPEN